LENRLSVGGNKANRLVRRGNSNTFDKHRCEELESSMPEADQLLLIATKYWKEQRGGREVTMSVEDADVKVAVTAYAHVIAAGMKFSVLCGKGDYRKRVDVHESVERLKRAHGEHAGLLLSTVVAMHCVSGCDTVSYLLRRSKRMAWQTLVKMLETQADRQVLQYGIARGR